VTWGGAIPISRRLLLIIWPFLALLRVDVLSAGRAYVGGEGLWSKAQKDALLSGALRAGTLRRQ